MDELTLGLVILGVSLANLIFGLVRTYYARYAKKTYKGSVNYWASWQKRKFDVAVEVLKEMGIESKDDFKKLLEACRKKNGE